MHRIAVDCDLGRLHAWSSEEGRVAYCETLAVIALQINALSPDLVLYEISSPIMYGEGTATYSRLSWALWNMAMAPQLAHLLTAPMVVAPSSEWTRKLKEPVRQKLAGCTAPNHDLRECEAMLWFHAHEPHRWVPLDNYLEQLVKIPSPKTRKK